MDEISNAASKEISSHLNSKIQPIINILNRATTLAEQYEAIQMVRQLLTAQNLSYRIGVEITVEGKKRTVVVELSGDILQNYLSGGGSRLRLAYSKLQNDIQSIIINQYNGVLRQGATLTEGMYLDVNAGDFYDSLLSRMLKEGTITRTKISTSKGSEQTRYNFFRNGNKKYTLGDIFENIDRLYLSENRPSKSLKRSGKLAITDTIIDQFIENFGHDSTIGFAQGDTHIMIGNKMYQFQQKINEAKIMSRDTIERDFQSLIQVLQDISQKSSENFIKNKLGADMTTKVKKILEELSKQWAEEQVKK